MKLKNSVVLAALAASIIFPSMFLGHHVKAVDTSESDQTPIFRIYNPNSGEHLYTPSGYEVWEMAKLGWRDEGVAWTVPFLSNAGGQGVTSPAYDGRRAYRIYNPNAGDHFYSTSRYEINQLLKLGWKDDGIYFWMPTSGTTEGSPVYRLYNPNAKAGAHFYTLSTAERDSLVKAGWKYEGVAWNAFPSTMEIYPSKTN